MDEGKRHPASQVSMVCANFKNSPAFEKVLLDWFDFLGGRPGEVVVVDGGSDIGTHEMYLDMMRRGLIDKLQLIPTHHPDNSRQTCYIQEVQAGAFTSLPYLLFWKSDTLPFRKGHENWLGEAIDTLERADTFAVGGSFNIPSKASDAWPGHYFSDRCSLNFSLMKRESFMDAMHEFSGDFIASGFRSLNPGLATGQERYIVEKGFEVYMERHGKFTVAKVEDETWTVFHTNAADDRLLELREKYRNRVDLGPYLNARTPSPLHGGCFYGKKRSRAAEARATVGRWKRIAMNKLTGRPTGLPPKSTVSHGVGRAV